MDYTWLKWIKRVQIGSNLSKVDEACQNWLKIESNWFKCAQNRSKFVQTFQNQNVQKLGLESSFQSFLAGKAHFHKGTHNVLISIVKPLQRVPIVSTARLAQSVEHETLNLRVVSSSPTLGDLVLQGSFLGLRFKRKNFSIDTYQKQVSISSDWKWSCISFTDF